MKETVGCPAILVKDRDTAQLGAVELFYVFLHLGVDGLQEGTHKGDLAYRTHDRSLVPDVLD